MNPARISTLLVSLFQGFNIFIPARRYSLIGMVDNWGDLTNHQYIDETGHRTHVAWLGNLIMTERLGDLEDIFNVNDIKSRQYIITSCRLWKEFIKLCYSLGCSGCDDRGWKAADGKKEIFRQWMKTQKARKKSLDSNKTQGGKCSFFRYNDREFRKDNIIVTVFDTKKQKRLMADGSHRAAALTMACNDGVKISDVRVVECYGDNVAIIFPYDIHQLPDI